MLKIIGIGLVICGSTATGLAISRDMEKRILELNELQKMLKMLAGEIGYANATLAESFHHVAKRIKKPFSCFLENMALHMEAFLGHPMQEIFQRHVEEDLSHTALLAEDLEQLVRFGEQLGYLDVKMQLNAIAMYERQLCDTCTQAREVFKSKSKVCRYLGVMGGLFLAVLFV